MNPFECGFGAMRKSHDAEVQQQAKDARKLAALDGLADAAEAVLDWNWGAGSPWERLNVLREQVKKARLA